MYVTLEPCCHHGKQPPCTDAILAVRHPPGGDRLRLTPIRWWRERACAILRAHGVEVTEDVLQEECDALNEVFFHYITDRACPLWCMKYAMTLDGKIASLHGRVQVGHRARRPGAMSSSSGTGTGPSW